MAEVPPSEAENLRLAGVWGFTADANPAADPTQAATQAWAGFVRAVGTNVPRHVNRTVRLRAAIRQLGRL